MRLISALKRIDKLAICFLAALPSLANAQESSAELAWEDVKAIGTPETTDEVSFGTEEIAVTQLSVISDLLSNERRAPALILGTVIGLQATRDVLPEEILPADYGMQVVTDMRVRVSEVICGTLGDTVLTIRYVGGSFASGATFHNSEMPSDPALGSQFVFVTQEVDGRNYLNGGRNSMLITTSNDVFLDSDGNRISRTELIANCL